MGTSRPPKKVKLFVGLLSADIGLLTGAGNVLEKRFKNKIDYESDVMDFAHTDYYEPEMGGGLKRRFLSFKRLVGLKNVYTIKQKTNVIEKKLSRCGMRRINIDPGYVDCSKVVLFTTKDYAHRIYLDGGIYAEVTLLYKAKTFMPWPWTYPDYKTSEYIRVFNTLREAYKDEVSAC